MKYQTSFPFLGILALIFITLKLVGVVEWSWWWVLAPIWGAWAVVALILILAFTFGALGAKQKRR